ncbi:MAG TPA: FCD domain-containing protein [Gaiellaceae bacterium]
MRPKAYEQVAERLRDLVVAGELEPGQRLPTESILAAEHGVSRATVREALRLLAAQNLIRTAKGATGGSYVTRPSPDHLSESLRSGLGLLAEAKDVSLEELVEARKLLEVPAARLAALRRADAHVEELHAAVSHHSPRLPASAQFVHNRDFHRVILDACGNTLLSIAAQPIFGVLQTGLARSRLGAQFHRVIHEQHRSISAAIEAGDADAAAGEMLAHLEYLTPFYEKAWRRQK